MVLLCFSLRRSSSSEICLHVWLSQWPKGLQDSETQGKTIGPKIEESNRASGDLKTEGFRDSIGTYAERLRNGVAGTHGGGWGRHQFQEAIM